MSAAMARVFPSTVMSPVLTMWPSGAVTLMMLVLNDSGCRGVPLRVRVTLPGLVVTVSSAAGVVEASASCGCEYGVS